MKIESEDQLNNNAGETEEDEEEGGEERRTSTPNLSSISGGDVSSQEDVSTARRLHDKRFDSTENLSNLQLSGSWCKLRCRRILFVERQFRIGWEIVRTVLIVPRNRGRETWALLWYDYIQVQNILSKIVWNLNEEWYPSAHFIFLSFFSVLLLCIWNLQRTFIQLIVLEWW